MKTVLNEDCLLKRPIDSIDRACMLIPEELWFRECLVPPVQLEIQTESRFGSSTADLNGTHCANLWNGFHSEKSGRTLPVKEEVERLFLLNLFILIRLIRAAEHGFQDLCNFKVRLCCWKSPELQALRNVSSRFLLKSNEQHSILLGSHSFCWPNLKGARFKCLRTARLRDSKVKFYLCVYFFKLANHSDGRSLGENGWFEASLPIAAVPWNLLKSFGTVWVCFWTKSWPGFGTKFQGKLWRASFRAIFWGQPLGPAQQSPVYTPTCFRIDWVFYENFQWIQHFWTKKLANFARKKT